MRWPWTPTVPVRDLECDVKNLQQYLSGLEQRLFARDMKLDDFVEVYEQNHGDRLIQVAATSTKPLRWEWFPKEKP